ncbi:pyrroline-5-carboxylate reductase [Chromobacterium sphagni]|uniref:Pyrroline-5-carboxylate reductase n=1 Tax=Chromobacterium sphagni TaxID=1903179 RepID=A0A1S1WXS5_9NEIS|nr:pyrroline-5-carboxylate reductase [Chromobacterium sphagni]OHX12097.1 pyrroline-5-carboxylate reductase [Chromobacterium sphagni]OHX21820.1 pyrroline-5-carboxylate reductase [Chromobacterium sphagni]
MQITFIGGGNMAGAIIGGLARQGGHRIHVVEHQQDKLDQLAADFGCSGGQALPERFSADDVVVLAVKPQQLRELCLELAPRLGGALVVSIAAGIRLDALARWLGSGRIVRVMPNTPAMVGKGVSGLFAAAVPASDRAAAETIMRAAGLTVWLDDEAGIDDITSVSGSGPAYVFYFIESMIEAGVKAGFSESQARELVLATFDGAVELARQSPLPVATLRRNVMSKGGTTERAIARFEAEGVKAAIVAGAMDCRERSVEMGQQLSQE